MTPYGPEGRESRRVAFKNSRFNTGVFTEAQFQYTEHLTRDTMWQPHLLVHANGALALDRLTLCAPDRGHRGQLVPLLGIAPVANAQGEQVFEFAAADRKGRPRPGRCAPGEPTPPLPWVSTYATRCQGALRPTACRCNWAPAQRPEELCRHGTCLRCVIRGRE
jgi:hypothetical protein